MLNKNKTKVGMLIVLITMVIGCSNAELTAPVGAELNSEVTSAVSLPVFTESGYSWNASSLPSFVIDIVVKNIAYNKSVTVVYSYDNWNTVLEASASYKETINGTYERWNVQQQHTNAIYTYGKIEFAVRYSVNNATYWDNNGGANFILKGQDNRNFVTEMNYAYAWNQSGAFFTGDVKVKNLDYSKIVKVTCSYAGSQSVVYASYKTSIGGGYEIWDFQDSLSGYASTLSWTTTYQVGGMTFTSTGSMQVPGEYNL